MRYTFLILFFCTSLFIISCNDWGKGKFKLTNNTAYLIDSINLMPDNRPTYFSLKSGGIKYYKTDMSGPGTDGLYQITYRINGITKTKDLGYYSNGASTEKLIKIFFEADTIRLERIWSNY